MLVCAAVLGGGCTKEAETVSVRFRATSLGVDIESMSTKGTSSGADLGDVVSTIGYVVLTPSLGYVTGESVSFNPATESAPDDFGVFSAVLPVGSYVVRMYAYGAGTGLITMSRNTEQFEGYDRDFFYLSQDLNVTAEQDTYDLSVPREAAMLRVNITDDVPASVTKVTYSISTKEKRAGSSAADNMSTAREYQATKTGSKLDTKDIYIPFPARNPSVTLNIKVYEGSDTESYSVPVQVSMYSNRRTVVSGRLFDTLNGKDLSVTIQDTWGADNNVNLQ